MDSVDFAALDFFVGAICVSSRGVKLGGFVGVEPSLSMCRWARNFKFRRLPFSYYPLYFLISSSVLHLLHRTGTIQYSIGAVALHPADLSIVYVG